MSMEMDAIESEEEKVEMRKGPWTDEEDSLLINYITLHGEGHWNSLSRCAGLKRTGKSCRLRWLNYLRPDVRRGNITLKEQLLILQLHSRLGNRWSKIAQHLPGRTDNEIKNYWRTRVQKQAKQLKYDVDSKQFKDTMRYIWMPQIAERIRNESEFCMGNPSMTQRGFNQMGMDQTQVFSRGSEFKLGFGQDAPNLEPEMSGCSIDSLDTQVSPVSDLNDCKVNVPGGDYFWSFQDGPSYCPDFMDCSSGFQLEDNNANALLAYRDLNDESISYAPPQHTYEDLFGEMF